MCVEYTENAQRGAGRVIEQRSATQQPSAADEASSTSGGRTSQDWMIADDQTGLRTDSDIEMVVIHKDKSAVRDLRRSAVLGLLWSSL